MPLEVSIVKHGFNPYFPQNHPPQHPVSNPQIRIQNEQTHMKSSSQRMNNPRISQIPAQFKIPSMNQINYHKTNQTAQPIKPLNRSFQTNNEPMIKIAPPNSRPASRSNDRYSHLHQS